MPPMTCSTMRKHGRMCCLFLLSLVAATNSAHRYLSHGFACVLLAAGKSKKAHNKANRQQRSRPARVDDGSTESPLLHAAGVRSAKTCSRVLALYVHWGLKRCLLSKPFTTSLPPASILSARLHARIHHVQQQYLLQYVTRI